MKQLKIKKSQAGSVITTTEDYVVYKKVIGSTSNMINKCINGIAILWIPKGSKIVVSVSYRINNDLSKRKLRCNRAICLGIVPYIFNYGNDTVTYQQLDDKFKYRSTHSMIYKYEQGKYLVPTRPFNDNIFTFCKAGIHFFETVKDAENY
jgi:hypothetical protein